MLELGYHSNALPELRPRVLVVDDDPLTLHTLAEALMPIGVELRTARSGADALRVAMECEHLSTVVLDVVIPDMSGFELAARLRQRPCLAHLPLLFMSGVALERQFVTRGFEFGGVDYLFKPLDLHLLRYKVRAIVELYQARERELVARAQARVADLREHQMLRRELERLRAASEQGGELRTSPRATSLVDVVHRFVQLHGPSFEVRGVELDVSLPAVAPIVMVERVALSSALRELCKHAVGAMPSGGTLHIELSRGDREARLGVVGARSHAPEPEPDALRRVRDSIDAQHGRLELRELPGNRTSFEIVLPLCERESLVAEPR